MAIIIEANHVNGASTVSTTPDILGEFPGVVCFYRSEKQMKGEYGKKEYSSSAPLFGFDTYIPKLHGEDNNVVDSYLQSAHIKTAFKVVDKDNNPQYISMYPNDKELIHGTSRVQPTAEEYKYRCSWVYLATNDVTLHVNVLFPKGKLGAGDDFLTHKSTSTDPTHEAIHFKIVNVNDDYIPIEVEANGKKQNQYEAYSDTEGSTLTVSVGNPFSFDFNSNNTTTEINISRTGDNKKAALIAYYIRKDNGIDKEYIVGQVNIIPLAYEKEDQYYDENIDYPKANLPILFVNVAIRKVKIDGNNKIVSDTPPPNHPLMSINTMVNTINQYFKPIGLGFQAVKNLYTTMELVEMESGGTRKLMVAGNEFAVDTNGMATNSTNGAKSLDEAMKEAFVEQMVNTTFYNNPLYADWKRRKPMKEESTNLVGRTNIYEDFLTDYSDFCPKNVPNSLFSSRKERDKELAFRLSKDFATVAMDSVFVVYCINDINLGDPTASGGGTSAYTQVSYRQIIAFSKAMQTWESTLTHELGHSLGLNHSFWSYFPIFPKNVSFDANWATDSQTLDGTDYKGYGATYDNIMDYDSESGSLNTDMRRFSLTKDQWQRIYGAIISLIQSTHGNLSDALRLTLSINRKDAPPYIKLFNSQAKVDIDVLTRLKNFL